MTNGKKTTHVVCHPSLYLRVNGKLQQMDMDAPLTLADDVAKCLVQKGFVKPVSVKAPVKAGKKATE